ncbi:hypothetical protein [Citrobacter sp. JL978]|uniref:hypothetical protein n=1 Tax=Citrobacter sp. JL978 TaxID=2652398 RepID=UPI0012D8B806|nr:hypothetical protein [Citrobacter sp. JL978]MTZ81987.1 hypothetical protein [Citrobacter sp. JL978]
MRYRKPADINSERERLLNEMGDKNSEHYQLWLKDKKHPIVKANQTRLNDLDAAFFPSRRGKPACSPTPSFPEKNPSKVGYWLDYPRDRDELYRSAIIDTLAKSGASLPQVIELVADILVNNVGIVESAINNIQTHAKNKGKLLMPNGKYTEAKVAQGYFDTLSIRDALFRLLTFNEKLLESKQKEAASKGGDHGKKPETLKRQLKAWVIKQWNSQEWASQDAFIMRIREIAPPERAETLAEMPSDKIKEWLLTKKKNNTKNN